jgi:hypothetical protein
MLIVFTLVVVGCSPRSETTGNALMSDPGSSNITGTVCYTKYPLDHTKQYVLHGGRGLGYYYARSPNHVDAWVDGEHYQADNVYMDTDAFFCLSDSRATSFEAGIVVHSWGTLNEDKTVTGASATFTYTIAGVTNAVDIDTVCYNPDYDLWVWILP